MKTQYYTATSLDGFIATEDDSLDWLFQLGDQEDSTYPDFIAQVGALAMGSTTYEWVLNSLQSEDNLDGSGWPYTQPTWVFTSRELPAIEGADIRYVKGEIRPVYDQIKEVSGDKNIWVVGGGDLAGQFYDAGLLDELIVQVGSVILSQGKPLLPRRVLSPNLKLLSVDRIGLGMVELRYEIIKADRNRKEE